MFVFPLEEYSSRVLTLLAMIFSGGLDVRVLTSPCVPSTPAPSLSARSRSCSIRY